MECKIVNFQILNYCKHLPHLQHQL